MELREYTKYVGNLSDAIGELSGDGRRGEMPAGNISLPDRDTLENARDLALGVLQALENVGTLGTEDCRRLDDATRIHVQTVLLEALVNLSKARRAYIAKGSDSAIFLGATASFLKEALRLMAKP